VRQGADEGLRSGRAKERPAAHAGLHARAWQGAQLAMSLAIHKGGHLRPDTRFKERYPSPPQTSKSATLRHPGTKNSDHEFPAIAPIWKRCAFMHESMASGGRCLPVIS
jgi:hypothetical protein